MSDTSTTIAPSKPGFTDRNGRRWDVAITLLTAVRVKGSLGIELHELLRNRFAGLVKLMGDVEQLANVLYVVCERQAKELFGDDTATASWEFGASAIAGDTLADAAEALVEALCDFFPCTARDRKILRKAIAKSREVRELALSERK